MAILTARGGNGTPVSEAEVKAMLVELLDKINKPMKKVLLLPPDHTRLNSFAGPITAMLYEMLTARGAEQIDVMPALGTHAAMSEAELKMMFGDTIPMSAFKVHDWRNDVVEVGVVSGELIKEWSEGKLDYDVKAMVNKIVFDGYDVIFSPGQVVPHEVVGMANYTKNIMVGIGGSDMINKSHFVGASCNMEKIMGQATSPVRKLFNYAVENFLSELPICYIQTVRSRGADGAMQTDCIYASFDDSAYLAAVKVAQETNLTLLDKPLKKVVVWLDPDEFKSTWLGNKSVYRTRMAIDDDGDLIVLAPALKEFGEDKEIDRLLRKYGYHGTPATLEAVKNNEDLRNNLGAAAHMIHGSSEGRFRITYCPGEHMSREEIEGVGFNFGDLAEMMAKYDVKNLKDGFNTVNGEEIFYISNPALGLWAVRDKFYSK